MQLEKEQQGAGPALSDEAATDLRTLQALADNDPNEVPDPNEPPPPPPPAPLDQEIAGLVLMLSKVVTPAFPSLAAIYNEETCGAVGAAVAGVCDKYGWMQGGVGGEYGPEIMCLCVVGPLAFSTHAAIKADIEARAPKRPAVGADGQPAKSEPPAGALRAPGSDTVTIGTVIQ